MRDVSKVSFVLAATDHGPLIVNRNDRVIIDDNRGYGVGFQLLERGCFDPEEASQGLNLLRLKAKYRGNDVVAVDVGANIGAFTVLWAKHMTGWGFVHAFECQERIFYALCGNIVLNNLSNAHAYLGAVTDQHGLLKQVSRLDFDKPGSYGSMGLIEEKNADVGQEPTEVTDSVWTHSLDKAFTGRVDFVKIDVEGMELDVLNGSVAMIDRERPILSVEHLKSDKATLFTWVTDRGYTVFGGPNNLLCVHRDDPCLNHLRSNA